MTNRYVPLDEWVGHLRVAPGATVLVASDVRRLAMIAARHGERFHADRFIEQLQRGVGARGTLLFPTFHWGFCRGEPFDYATTPSATGALSTAALRRPDFRRSHHPIYSFAVWGRQQSRFLDLHNVSSFGADSPFALLREVGATMLLLGVDMQHSFTLVHHAEEMEGVEYRFVKSFSAPYTGLHGTREERTYSMYVRDPRRGVVMHLDPLADLLEQAGVAPRFALNGVQCTIVDVARAFELMVRDIRENGGRNLHREGGSPA